MVTLWGAFLSAAGKPNADSVRYDALYDAPIEGHQRVLRELFFPEEFEEMPDLLHRCCNVSAPGEVLLNTSLKSAAHLSRL